MILFKPEHVEPILEGRKTQTRRQGKKRWNVGATHQLRTSMYGEPFARVRILNVRQESLGEISEADARAEGYRNRQGFLDAFVRINKLGTLYDLGQKVWVVEFELEGRTG